MIDSEDINMMRERESVKATMRCIGLKNMMADWPIDRIMNVFD